MVNQIRPLARLFRGMADLIDRDQISRTRYEAIAKAAGVVAARASAQELVAGRLWQVDGADLLASAYAFHAGLPRQPATAAHVQAMQQPDPAPASAQPQPPPIPPGRPGLGDPEAGTAPSVAPASSVAAPWTHIGCPVLALASWTRPMWPSSGRSCPTCPAARHPPWPAHRVDRLDPSRPGCPAAAAAGRRSRAGRSPGGSDRQPDRPNDPATPALAVVMLGWLEAANQVLAAGEQPPGAAGLVERGQPARPATH